MLSFDNFVEQYNPIENDEDSILFETYGEDLEKVKQIAKADNRKVWTLVDGEDDKMVLINGYHLVNRVAYVITEHPSKDENLEVLYSEEEEV